MSEQLIKKASTIIYERSGKQAGTNTPSFCSLAVVDSNGYPHITTITTSKSDGIKTIYLCTGLNSKVIERIKNSNKTSICFNSNEYTFTLDGTAEIVIDSSIKEEMWYDGLKNHFKEGASDPNYCVIKFNTHNYSLLIDWQEVHGSF